MISPAAMPGRKHAFCSSVPRRRIAGPDLHADAGEAAGAPAVELLLHDARLARRHLGAAVLARPRGLEPTAARPASSRTAGRTPSGRGLPRSPTGSPRTRAGARRRATTGPRARSASSFGVVVKVMSIAVRYVDREPRAEGETLRFEPTRATPPHASSPTTSSTTARPFPPGARCCSSSARRPRPSPLRGCRRVRRPPQRRLTPHLHTSPSGGECTSASAPRFRVSKDRVALDELLNRFPEWDVDLDGIELTPTSTVHGWQHMPIVIS